MAKSLMNFLVEEHIADTAVAGSASKFYVAEFDRALTGLWDVLNAASPSRPTTQ